MRLVKALFPCLLLSIAFICSDERLQAQVRVDGHFQNIPLADALRSLEQSANLRISYDPALLQNIRISASFSNKTPAEAFEILLRETPLVADIMEDRYVVLRKRGESSPAPATRTLCARALDAESREALIGVTVSTGSGQGTQSGVDGRFTLKINAGALDKDSVYLRYLGYQTLRLPAKMLATGNCPDLFLHPSSQALMEIVVTDHAVEPIGLPKHGASDTEVRPDRGGFVPSLGEPDPFRMIQFLPGVAAAGDKAGDLIVRGGNSDQNLVLWEGIPIYHSGHLFGVVSALNPYVVNRVNVWKGNFGADMGGRASSIIDMRSEPRALEKPTVSAGLNLVSAYFSFETPLLHHKAGLLVAARSAFSDVLANKAYQKLFGYAIQDSRIRSDYMAQQSNSVLLHAIQILPVSQFNDANLKFYWQIKPHTRFELSAYSGTDVLKYRVDAKIPNLGFYYAGGDTVQEVNVGMSMKIRRQWTDQYYSEWQLASSGFQTLFNYAGSSDSLHFPQRMQHQENTLNESVFRFDNGWRLSRRTELHFGFQSVKTANLFYQRVADLVSGEKQDVNVDLPSNQSAFYGILRFGDSTRWSIETGLRHVTFNYATRSYWEPRFSAQWEPFAGFRLKFNSGSFRQYMRKAYIGNDLGLNNEIWFTADDNGKLPVLENRQFSAGFSWTRRGWMLDVESYSKILNPLTGINLRFNGTPQTLWDTRGSELARGLELLLRKRWGWYTQWFSYTYAESVAHYDSLNAGFAFPTDFDQRNSFSWAHHFNLKHWSLSFAWNFHTGRPYTPPTGIRSETKPDGSIERSVVYGPRNSARLPNYSRIDASLQYQFRAGKLNGTAGLSIFNYLNRPNLQNRAFFVETAHDDAGEAIYRVGSIERTLLGRMVNVFVLGRF